MTEKQETLRELLAGLNNLADEWRGIDGNAESAFRNSARWLAPIVERTERMVKEWRGRECSITPACAGLSDCADEVEREVLGKKD